MHQQAEDEAGDGCNAEDESEIFDKTGKRNLPYIAGTAVEELLEMLGVVIWFGVMIRARDEIAHAKQSPRTPES